jgi:hypothetical protein
LEAIALQKNGLSLRPEQIDGIVMNPFTISKIHLKNSNTNYWRHFYQAFSLGLLLIWSGITSVIHAVFPFLYPAYSAKKVAWMYIRFVMDNPNPDLQAYLAEEMASRNARLTQRN